MSKTNEQLLLDYKKSNKERRKRILQKEGYALEADYLTSLMSDTEIGSPAAAALFKHNKPIIAKPTVHNVNIVDISGSMSGGKIRSAIQGVNDEINELKNDKDIIYTHTIVEFSEPTHIKTLCYKQPIGDAKAYTTSTRGSTALNQAVGETLYKLKNDLKTGDKVLVKIFTDGGENSSQGEWANSTILAQLIKDCEALGFTVTFVGTKAEVQYAINNLQVDASNTLTHDNTSVGVFASFSARSTSNMAYKSKLLKGEDVSKGFYKTLNEKK